MDKIYIKNQGKEIKDEIKFDENFKSFYVEDTKLNRLKYFDYLIKDRKFNYSDISKENLSIYIGQNIGEKILPVLKDAKKRIYILSPYSKEYVYEYLDEINRKNQENFEMKIASSIDKMDLIEKDYENLKKDNEDIKKVKDEIINIGKDKLVVEDLVKKMSKWIKATQFLLLIMLPILAFVIFTKNKYIWTVVLVFNLIVFAFLVLYNEANNRKKLSNELTNSLEQKGKEYNSFLENFAYNCNDFDNRIRKYRALENMSVKLTKKEDKKIHAKLIIIDDIAYLGTFNLAYEDCFENIETLIEIKDKDILNELIERFEQIYSLIGTEVYDKLLEMLEDLNNWEGKN